MTKEDFKQVLDALQETRVVLSNLRQQIEIWQGDSRQYLKNVKEDFYNLDAKVNRILRDLRDRGALS